MQNQETINIRVLDDSVDRYNFIRELLEQKAIVQGTVFDEEKSQAVDEELGKLAKEGAYPCIAPFAFTIISLIPTALPQFTSFITTYMTARSNEKIVFEAEKKGKKVHIEIPAGLNEEDIQKKLTPLKKLFESL